MSWHELPLLRWPAALLALSAATTSASNAWATDPDRVEWSPDWPRVRLVEWLDVAALTLASAEISSQWRPRTHPVWEGGILFDDAVRGSLRGRTYRTQKTAADLSDAFYLGGVFAPNLIDVFLVDLGIHQNADVGLQMLLMNMQSLGIAGVLSLASEKGVGRARPYTRDCGTGGVVRDASGNPLLSSCGNNEDNQSFYSGHAAATATMAGLTCAHHQHLPLYGGGLADLAPCVAMIGVSLTTGVARVVADRHYATDVLTGWMVGTVSGYVLPSLLHYGFNAGRPVGEVDVAGVMMLPVPQVYEGGAGLALAGVY